MENNVFNIKLELKKLPEKPGVYIMKSSSDEIIYVGKAKNLKKRVSQYFLNTTNQTLKTKKMVPNISEFEYIITDSEDEALILECNLIKRYKPKYNILLKDDKSYPYIKVTVNENYPKVYATRQYLKDKAKYYGPFTNVTYMNNILEMIHKIFRVRNCRLILKERGNNHKPCLNYHIGLCDAPCNDLISKEKYDKMISKIIYFLEGNKKEMLDILQQEMMINVEKQNFEEAAKYRDYINLITEASEKQKMQQNIDKNQDIIAFYAANNEWIAQIFFVRDGKIIGREHYFIKNTRNESKQGIINEFIKQYYVETDVVPKEIVLEDEINEKENIESLLSKKAGYKVNIVNPKMGTKHRLLILAKQNARITMEQFGEKIKKEKERSLEALNELKELLNTDNDLQRIESYDISNIQGVYNVGAMVVFEDGVKKKSDYRKFKVRTVYGADDYASMMEVVRRRFENYLKENNKFSKLPDIILVDGGKGQVNVVERVLRDMSINVIVCGLVKDKNHNTRGIFYKNEELEINKNSELFKFITRIQDEVHRFAIEYFRTVKNNDQFKSELDNIEGIGGTRKMRLLKRFGSLEKIKKAEIEELVAVEGMNMKSAENVYEYFRTRTEES